MRLDLKRNAILIIPESDQDNAYLEDTLSLLKTGDSTIVERVNDVSLGYVKNDTFVLKIQKSKETAQ